MRDMSFTDRVGRTYKYWRGDPPLWEFGSGLSFTNFAMDWDGAPPGGGIVTKPSDSITLAVKVDNVGSRDGDEVVMLFHSPGEVVAPPGLPLPKRRLVRFERLGIPRGASRVVTFTVSAAELGLVDFSGDTVLYPGPHLLYADRGHGPALSLNVSVQIAAPVMIESLL